MVLNGSYVDFFRHYVLASCYISWGFGSRWLMFAFPRLCKYCSLLAQVACTDYVSFVLRVSVVGGLTACRENKPSPSPPPVAPSVSFLCWPLAGVHEQSSDLPCEVCACGRQVADFTGMHDQSKPLLHFRAQFPTALDSALPPAHAFQPPVVVGLSCWDMWSVSPWTLRERFQFCLVPPLYVEQRPTWWLVMVTPSPRGLIDAVRWDLAVWRSLLCHTLSRC